MVGWMDLRRTTRRSADVAVWPYLWEAEQGLTANDVDDRLQCKPVLFNTSFSMPEHIDPSCFMLRLPRSLVHAAGCLVLRGDGNIRGKSSL